MMMNIEQIIPYDNNPRNNKNAIDKVSASIKEFGFNSPILISPDYVVIAGHTRLMAAKKLGLIEVPVKIIEGLTDAQIKAYRIADNRTAQEATWNDELLSIEIKELQDLDFDLSLTGFGLDEIDTFLNSLEVDVVGECDPDEDIEINQDVNIKDGDIFILGNHKLMCGDCTNIDNIDKLMDGKKVDMVFTDPPYNTGMKANKGSKLNHMFNDSFTDEEWENFMACFISSYWMIMKEDSTMYVCLDWRRNHQLIPHIEENGFKRSNLIVWDKMVHGLGSDYKYTHEFINVCKKGSPFLETNQGEDREYSDVWHIQRKMGKDDDHATKKPIELCERAIRHATKNKNTVADLFGGSGSTLIACEKTNRICYMMEISPIYCDVIIRRWEKFTGKKAELYNSSK